MSTGPSPRSGKSSRDSSRSYSVTVGDHHIVLAGEAVIGRGKGCQVMLKGTDISRRHASLTPSEEGILLADLGSFNGVFLNGARIAEPTRLATGDVITIGGISMRFAEGEEGVLHDIEDPSTDGEEDERTLRADKWDILQSAGLALLQSSRPEMAERVLTPMLLGVLDLADAPDVDPDQLDEVAEIALGLARATGKARWVSYVLDLYGAAEYALPAERGKQLTQIATELAAAKEDAGAQIRERISRYLQIRRARRPEPDASERATLDDLEVVLRGA